MEGNPMKRRTLDILFSAGGAVFAILLLVLGLVLNNQANFAEDYVRDQLSQQQITFAPEEVVKEREAAAPGGDCLIEYAGKTLATGKQAECYANQFIAFHMRESTTKLADETGNAAYDGATYATLGGVTRGLQAQIAEGGDTAALEEELGQANALRETMFKGETLRGLLLTTYGFSIFGERAALAATVCFIAAALVLLLSIAGLVHAARTPRDERILV
jgi:hypothetical protein